MNQERRFELAKNITAVRTRARNLNDLAPKLSKGASQATLKARGDFVDACESCIDADDPWFGISAFEKVCVMDDRLQASIRADTGPANGA